MYVYINFIQAYNINMQKHTAAPVVNYQHGQCILRRVMRTGAVLGTLNADYSQKAHKQQGTDSY